MVMCVTGLIIHRTVYSCMVSVTTLILSRYSKRGVRGKWGRKFHPVFKQTSWCEVNYSSIFHNCSVIDSDPAENRPISSMLLNIYVHRWFYRASRSVALLAICPLFYVHEMWFAEALNLSGRLDWDKRLSTARPPLIRGSSNLVKKSTPVVLPELARTVDSPCATASNGHQDGNDRNVPDSGDEVPMSSWMSDWMNNAHSFF